MNTLQRVIERIQPLDKTVMANVKEHVDNLTKPVGALGRIEELAIQLAGITGEERPTVEAPAIVVAAADHGIIAEGVSAYPQEVTKLMIANFVKGSAAINIFGRQIGATVKIVDVGVNGEIESPGVINKKIKNGTANFLEEQAMTKAEATKAIEAGIEVADELINNGHKLLITGEMGIGNTTASSALTAAYTSASVEEVVGFGTGVDEEGFRHKAEIIKQALAKHEFTKNDPLDTFAKVGGLEIGALAGVILQGAARNIPVIVDGFISSAAALVAYELCPTIKEHLIISHRSVEPGQGAVFHYLEKSPLLALDLRLGEGTGAALAYPLLNAACGMLKEMATFADLGIKRQ